MTEPRKFAPPGPLALDPRAFGMLLLMSYQAVTVERDGVTVLSIRGPLEQFASPFCDSYESIVARVEAALSGSSRPRAIVLSIASPGGVVVGCFEAAARIRSTCARAGVPLVSYIDGQACSAAYALACAASHIAASPTATVGSIGVIAEVVDATAKNALSGVAVRMISSGERKADGNPNAGLVGGPTLTSVQAMVDRLAGEFFAFVATSRGIDADAVRALEAAVFIGADAQSMSLTDSTQTLDELLANVGSLTTVAGPAVPPQAGPPAEGSTMSKAYDEAIAALRKAAESDDPKESAKAKRMLKAELAEDDAPPASEPDGDEPPAPAPKKEDAAAAAPNPPGKDDDAKALKADVAQLKAGEAERKAAAVALERKTLLATRPDFSAEHVATLMKATTPIELVREQVASIPRGVARKPAAAASVQGTRGEGQNSTEHPSNLPPDEAHALDVQMGLATASVEIRMEGTRQILPAMTREQARAEIARREKLAASQVPTTR